jgi:hypothetical protein
MRRLVVTFALLLVTAACDHGEDSFRVRVLTQDNEPVAGAVVSGGIDWDWFRSETNVDGYAEIPDRADGDAATVFKDNFYPTSVEVTPGACYTIAPTPESLRLLGELDGTALRFGPDTLVMVTYEGKYRVYTYGDGGVSLVDSAQLHSPVRHQLVHGDTFWYATYDSGFCAYSIADLRNPVKLLHVDIEGVLHPFAVKDSYILMGSNSQPGPLRVYLFRPDGSAQLVTLVGDQTVYDIAVLSHYAVTLGWKTDLPVVFDIADIRHPREVHHGVQNDFYGSEFHGNCVVLSYGPWRGDTTWYGLLDLTDPANPVDLGRFATDSYVDAIIDDTTVVERYEHGGKSVLKGSLATGFRTTAIVHPATYSGHHGGRPPYFLLGGSLWKLVGTSPR